MKPNVKSSEGGSITAWQPTFKERLSTVHCQTTGHFSWGPTELNQRNHHKPVSKRKANGLAQKQLWEHKGNYFSRKHKLLKCWVGAYRHAQHYHLHNTVPLQVGDCIACTTGLRTQRLMPWLLSWTTCPNIKQMHANTQRVGRAEIIHFKIALYWELHRGRKGQLEEICGATISLEYACTVFPPFLG